MPVAGLFRNAQETINVPAGGVVFHEGDAGHLMFGVVEGQVQLQTNGRIIATFGPDDVFGEMALIDKAPRMATAMAITDNVLATIDEHIFLFLVHETPRFALSVMSVMSDRLRDHASNQTEVEPRPTSS
jgi:CRP/FNR family transcriptional regulator, cyclic AMP receptor protein